MNHDFGVSLVGLIKTNSSTAISHCSNGSFDFTHPLPALEKNIQDPTTIADSARVKKGTTTLTFDDPVNRF